MMIDGRGFVVDITGRAITAEMRQDNAAVVLHVDTAMVVPAADANAAAALSPASLPMTNAGIARLLRADAVALPSLAMTSKVQR